MSDANAEHAEVIAPPPFIFLGTLALGLFLQKLFPISAMPRPVARLIGLPLLLGGFALTIWGFRTMKAEDTPVNPRESVRHLVTTGPFAYTRNPLYSSMTLIYLGITCLTNAFWPLLLLPGLVTLIRKGVIDREEHYLERRFGDEYHAYQERVPRWF